MIDKYDPKRHLRVSIAKKLLPRGYGVFNVPTSFKDTPFGYEYVIYALARVEFEVLKTVVPTGDPVLRSFLVWDAEAEACGKKGAFRAVFNKNVFAKLPNREIDVVVD